MRTVAPSSPVEQGGAQHPAGRRVGVAEGRGVLREGVVVDDGGLVVVETLAQKPFLRAGSGGKDYEGNGHHDRSACFTGLHQQEGREQLQLIKLITWKGL